MWEAFIDDDDVAWPLVLRFARWEHDDGRIAWLLVALELQRNADLSKTTDLADLAVLNQQELAEIAARLDYYKSLAVGYFEFDTKTAIQRGKELAARGKRGRRPLNDEFLLMIAREYRRLTDEGQPAITVLAREWRKDPSTVHRWVQKARSRGLLPDERKEE